MIFQEKKYHIDEKNTTDFCFLRFSEAVFVGIILYINDRIKELYFDIQIFNRIVFANISSSNILDGFEKKIIVFVIKSHIL